MKATLSINEQTKASMGDLPIRMSASKLFRWIVKLMVSDEKEWKKIIREEGEIKEVQDYIRPKLRMALGLLKEDHDNK